MGAGDGVERGGGLLEYHTYFFNEVTSLIENA